MIVVRRLSVLMALLLMPMTLFAERSALAQTPRFTIAVQSSLTGISQDAGRSFVTAIRFAIDEANATGEAPQFDLAVFDDASTEGGSQAAAQKIIESDAAIVLGPARTPLAISACRTYGEAGLPIIAATLHADELTDNPTTFRTVISTGEIGETLADYLGHILRAREASVMTIDNGYGRPFAARFKDAAARQGITASFTSFSAAMERDRLTQTLASQGASQRASQGAAQAGATAKDQPPIVLGMEYEDAVPVLMALRRAGYHGLVLGTATMARSTFAAAFAGEPEEQRQRGFFTDNTYAASPMILDSANAEVLAFADRFAARFGSEPAWETVQAYDGALLAMTALREAWRHSPDLARLRPAAQRAAALAAIEAFDDPKRAVVGLNGPIWFTPDRIRRQPVRIGRFHEGVFESAPLQLVPVAEPDAGERASGAVFETESGRFYRLQRVVQTGTFLNLIPHLNIPTSSFGADFYLWLRYAKDAGPGAADPVEIGFPNMLSGSFTPSVAAEATEMADGTEYRLWRIQGEFRNDFDLHRFPFDRQTLHIGFFNARASSDRIVYVLDRRSRQDQPRTPPPPSFEPGFAIQASHAATLADAAGARAERTLAESAAFADLTQWQPTGAHERRDTLVTMSALGDLRRVGLKTPRELSGFLVTFELQRRVAAALFKILLPMVLMTVIMYTTLHFPHALTKEKVTVEVTAVLSGAVLLSSVNNQLGGIGYTIAAEYGFYAFFALGLLCVCYVAFFEGLRLSGSETVAYRVEQGTRAIFLIVVISIVAIGAQMYLG